MINTRQIEDYLWKRICPAMFLLWIAHIKHIARENVVQRYELFSGFHSQYLHYLGRLDIHIILDRVI